MGIKDLQPAHQHDEEDGRVQQMRNPHDDAVPVYPMPLNDPDAFIEHCHLQALGDTRRPDLAFGVSAVELVGAAPKRRPRSRPT